jgi:hypothetical protein
VLAAAARVALRPTLAPYTHKESIDISKPFLRVRIRAVARIVLRHVRVVILLVLLLLVEIHLLLLLIVLLLVLAVVVALIVI